MILALLVLLPVLYSGLRNNESIEQGEIRTAFESGNFDAAYTLSGEMLKTKPLDTSLLTIHGFSSYQLAIAQINNSTIVSYIDECIWSLRKVLLQNENPRDGRIFYVLGKAYCYKGQGYADLAVKYLEKAREVSYNAPDIPEYLGPAYAAVGDYRNSVEAFTLALASSGGSSDTAVNPSDVLLLAIANSYLALDEPDSAKAYLLRCIELSKDSRNITAARLLLAGIFVSKGELEPAEEEYLKIIEDTGENAEAYFQLGEIYAAMGNTTRARAEWRRAFRIDPSHTAVRSRLN